MAVVVAEVIAEAKKRSTKAADLSLKIEQLTGHRYAESSVSAWIKGRAMPPADVFLAAVQATGISLDGLLYKESLLTRFTRLEEKVEELGRRPVAEATDS